jgi:hypothetical protein
LDHGTYRLRVQVPVTVLHVSCGETSPGPIEVFNIQGQHIGYVGEYSTSVTPSYYSNSVVVGETVPGDISYTFIDIPETGSIYAYDYGETAIMDASACTNYDLYWLAIFESGPTYNRYKSTGSWVSGTMGVFDISEFWLGTSNWKLEPYHSYYIQWLDPLLIRISLQG